MRNIYITSLKSYIQVLALTLNEVYKYRTKFVKRRIEYEAILILSLKF